jgi:hypothetical protein
MGLQKFDSKKIDKYNTIDEFIDDPDIRDMAFSLIFYISAINPKQE